MGKNLYEAWLKKEARLAFEREDGTTVSGESLATVDLSNKRIMMKQNFFCRLSA